MDQINWEPILWLAGGVITFFFIVISSLLTWIGFLYKRATEKIEIRMDKQDIREEKQDNRLTHHDKEIYDILAVMKYKFKIK